MVTDKWTKSAMRDGAVVAELLLSLKEAEVKPVFLANPAIATLRWGIRQPRSRSTRCDADSAKNSRCSPNTPLSWSDAYESTSLLVSGSLSVGSKSTESGLVGVGAMFSENDKSKRRKVMHQINEQPHHHQHSETGFLLPDLNMMPSQNDNLNHYFSPHVESLYGCIRIS